MNGFFYLILSLQHLHLSSAVQNRKNLKKSLNKLEKLIAQKSFLFTHQCLLPTAEQNNTL